MNLHLSLKMVYFLQGGDFPPHGAELQFSALVLLGQHLLHLLQLCLGPRQTVLLIHALLMDLFTKRQAECFTWKREEFVLHFWTHRYRATCSYTYRWKDIRPDSSRRPEHGHWCPELYLVADPPAPWLCTPQRATAPSSRCPVSQTAQRSRPGRWRGSGWTHRTRADRRKHVSKLWPRRSRSAWSDTLGSYTGVCRRRETWPWLWKVQKHFSNADQCSQWRFNKANHIHFEQIKKSIWAF